MMAEAWFIALLVVIAIASFIRGRARRSRRVWIVLERDFCEFQDCHGAWSSQEKAKAWIDARPNDGSGYWIEESMVDRED